MAALEQSFPECRVYLQVAMGALVQARKGLPTKRRTATRNRFDRKIIDFVLESRATGGVVALIELDDRTHDAAKDRARDSITRAAGYRTVRIPAGSKLQQFELQTLMAEKQPPNPPASYVNREAAIQLVGVRPIAERR